LNEKKKEKEKKVKKRKREKLGERNERYQNATTKYDTRRKTTQIMCVAYDESKTKAGKLRTAARDRATAPWQ